MYCLCSPNSNKLYTNSFIDYFDSLGATSQLVVVRDFNCSDITWSTLSCTSTFSSEVCDVAFKHNLFQLVHCPTHAKGNTLDLVLTDNQDWISNLQIYSFQGKSDHYLVYFNLSLRNLNLREVRLGAQVVFDYPKADWASFCNFLLDADFGACYDSQDVEEIWSAFKLIVLEGMNLFIPKVRLQTKQMPVWTTAALRHQLKCAKTLRRSYLHHKTPGKELKLRSIECSLQQEIVAAKRNYEYQLFDKSNGPEVFRYIRSLKQNGDIPSTIYLNSCKASSDKATLFNTFFHSVFTESSYELPDMHNLNTPLCNIILISQTQISTGSSRPWTQPRPRVWTGLGPMS